MTKQELKKFSEMVTTIKSITRVYEQAAARKMKMVKLEIEKIAEYLDAATNTYSSTKYAIGEGEKEMVKQRILTSSFRKVDKKTVLVLIASQDQYFGNLIPSIFKQFITEYQKSGSDAIIIGRTGKDLLDSHHIAATNIMTFDFDDALPEWDVIHKVSKLIGNYSQVVVFYGQYKSVLTQEAKNMDLSSMVVVRDVGEVKKYLFKPEPRGALSFLEQQMIAGGFLEKVYESQIAKYAARIKILEIGQVAQKISDALGDLAKGKRNVRKSSNNRKQQQLFTGATVWQQEGITNI